MSAPAPDEEQQHPVPRPRIKLEYRDPQSLSPHPTNPRKHADLYDQVGHLDAVIFNERTNHLVDGHMRLQEYLERNESEIPVIIVDLSEEDERLGLFFKDRIGEMATLDAQIVSEMRNLIETDSEILKSLADGDPTPPEEGVQLRGAAIPHRD